MARDQDYISEARAHARAVYNGLLALKAMQMESTYLSYSTTLPDGAGENAGVTKDEVIAVVFTSTDALETVMNAGHGSNFAKLL